MIAGGAAWLLADRPAEERRLSSLFDLFNDDDVTYRLAVILDQKQVRNRAAKAAFASFLQLPEQNTRPSVLGSVQTHLRLLDSDLTRRLTDTTTMDLDGFLAGAPMTLYIIVPPFRLSAYRPLLRMWLSGLLLLLTQRRHPPKQRTLMLCDEIGNLGRIEALLMATTLLKSGGLTVWSFCQNTAQLQIYGPQANTLLDNAGVVQIFGIPNYRMAQDLANVVGGISADALLGLPRNEQILLVESKLQRCRQVRHYDDHEFLKVA
jgi:type IV secretion system protein VirD4